MESFGRARRVRIYLSEGDRVGLLPAHTALLQLLHREGAQGATVFRGLEGFGATGEVHLSHLVDVAGKLPLVVEWIDQAERVERLMPQVRALLPRGFVTADDTEILLFDPRPIRTLPGAVTAGMVMSREVTTVSPRAPVRQVVELVLGQPYRALPVVEGGRLVGIITGSDLVERAGLAIRLDLLPRLGKPELQRLLEGLDQQDRTASQIMTPRPVTAAPATPLPEVALLMTRRRLKRLPVVDEAGALVGVVSRYDLLRSAGGGFGAPDAPPPELGLAADLPLTRVMRRDVPTVHPDTPLPETLQAVVSTRLNMALVVDERRHVVGLVSDAALLERITPALRSGVLRSLMRRLPFAQARPEAAEAAGHARAQTAGELMSGGVPSAREDTRLSEAIALMLRDRHKVLPVTDAGGALVGVVDRADLLHGLASRAG